MSRISNRFSQFSQEPLYNTKAVVQRTGVAADTLRAWERRYGMPFPERTEGRQRAYSERDIAMIDWLRQQTESGLTISQAVALLQTGSAIEQPTTNDAAGLQDLSNKCVQALLSFDVLKAEAILNQAFSVYPVETVCIEVIERVMVAIGDGWHAGTISISQEHAATAFMSLKLSNLIHQARTRSNRGLIIVATVPGEQHELGVMMVALFLMRRGWRVIYLGSNLPTSELLHTVQRLKPKLVALSATTRENYSQAAHLLQELNKLTKPLIIGYGGAALSGKEQQKTLPGSFLGYNAEQACDTIEELLA
ncbi:MerR family transcriptional regulator [Herpetosiphon giganteus]|uniref:MerR family transcriptional regulator n=1 Tax=Herpetosiphon giganteus TaxID=2029754 RepID=UPI00195CBE33|nr:cobalamin-dependent protein [Herpetosiphon giganteus]MBM7842393.1 methanogenic corrinoid protein MtbC1 [Herpetosiphon giganteus]